MHHTVLSSLKKIIQEIPVVVGFAPSDRYEKATHKTRPTPFDGKQGKQGEHITM